MVNNRKSLGEILRRQRLMMPMTLIELSAKSGVSPSHLGRIERGERFPSAPVLRKIAKPLGFEENYLFTLAGFLSPIERKKETEKTAIQGIDPYVAMVLAREPVEVQRAVVAILIVLKNIAKGTM